MLLDMHDLSIRDVCGIGQRDSDSLPEGRVIGKSVNHFRFETAFCI